MKLRTGMATSGPTRLPGRWKPRGKGGRVDTGRPAPKGLPWPTLLTNALQASLPWPPRPAEARATGQHQALLLPRPGKCSPGYKPSGKAVLGTRVHCGYNKFPREVSWKSVAAM